MLRSILIVCGALFLAGCHEALVSEFHKPANAARELDRQMDQLAEDAESCMTEKQCEQSKKRHLKICSEAKGIKACSSRKEAKYTWRTNCKTAENIVTINDTDSLRECCDRKGEDELERCNKIMFSEQECQRIQKIEVNACMRTSPASKAYSYTERTPEPLKPSTPSVGTPASTPVESSLPGEY